MTTQLLEAVHEVTVLDNLLKEHIEAVPTGARFIEGDLLNGERLSQILSTGFDGVLHFAALIADAWEWLQAHPHGYVH